MDREQRIQHIIEDLSRLQRIVSPEVWQKSGLSRAQTGMLFLLYYRPGSGMKNIAEHLSISKSAVTQLLEPLLEKELVIREADAHDRRNAVLKLTPKGLKTVRDFTRHKMLGIRTALGSLSDKELSNLERLSSKMAASVKIKETK